MEVLLIALLAGAGFVIAYHTYGRWLGRRIFELSAKTVCPSERLCDGRDYVPTKTAVVFGHHFTSIAATGPIVGPAIAVIWGWLPALLWVLFGSILIGAVHDMGSLVVSLRNNGQTVGDIAGRVLNRRVRVLFLCVLFLALTIIIAIFGLVIAAVFRQYPAAIFPCLVQIPIAVVIGLWLHRQGVSLVLPSLGVLGIMYLTVLFGNTNFAFGFFGMQPGEWGLFSFNQWFAGWPTIVWVGVMLAYSYIASVIPVWVLLQPRDYINALQLISTLALVVVGLAVAAVFGGAPVVEGGLRQPLELSAPMIQWNPEGAPLIFPFLFITIACGAISGFHCLVSSGTSSKQLRRETDAQFVGYGSMLTEAFLATLVILACVAGLGLGVAGADGGVLTGSAAWADRYTSWGEAGGLAATVGAFVDGAGNFLVALGMSPAFAIALMGVFVASFAATTLDTATRLQRYVIQELAVAFSASKESSSRSGFANPASYLKNRYVATLVAIIVAGGLASLPSPAAQFWTLETAGGGGLILWPLFGATNQLMGGLAFMVIAFWLWRREKPVAFIVFPLIFMLIIPAWAMSWQVFVEAPGQETSWLEDRNWLLLGIALITIVLEVWMIVEAVLLFPTIRGVEEPWPPFVRQAVTEAAAEVSHSHSKPHA
jgi:carbon starvation protein